MRQSVVCGVDGSKGASGAVRFARTLSDSLGLRLVVVNVTDVPMVSPRSAHHFYTELRAIALDAGEELLDWICETEGLSEEVVRRVELGDPAERLAAVSDEEKAELLVVGSRGRGRLTSAILGSVSADLARSARCPVAIVPDRSADSPQRPEGREVGASRHGRSWPSQAHLGGG